MNKDLKDRVFKIPDNVFDHIHKTLMSVKGESVDGIMRAKNLIRTKNVGYGQIKRIIHDLENEIDPNSIQYNLAGGQLMLDWAKTHLNGERDLLKNNKKSQQRSNEIGQIDDIRQNSFLKKHTKKSSNRTPVNMLKSNSDKTSVSPISSLGIFEEINRIKDLL